MIQPKFSITLFATPSTINKCNSIQNHQLNYKRSPLYLQEFASKKSEPNNKQSDNPDIEVIDQEGRLHTYLSRSDGSLLHQQQTQRSPWLCSLSISVDCELHKIRSIIGIILYLCILYMNLQLNHIIVSDMLLYS